MKQKKSIIFITLTVVFIILMSQYCLARAGGGGGGFSGGGGGSGGGGFFSTLLAFIFAPFFFLYSIYTTYKLKVKRDQVRALTSEISKQDALWNLQNMTVRVRTVFLKVQKAWMERNQDLAKDCMSDSLYEIHKIQTDDLIANSEKNILERINLSEVMIYSVSDYKDNSLDTFSAVVRGTMIDYLINTKTKQVVSGSATVPDKFEEIWTFIRVQNKWVLNEINQDASSSNIGQGQVFSENKNE